MELQEDNKLSGQLLTMPVCLVFLQVAKKYLQFDLQDPNVPALFIACNSGTGTNIFLSCVHIVKILPLIYCNCSKIIMYCMDKIVG